jgi:predicted Holliday junction resolvase-like endonuclease
MTLVVLAAAGILGVFVVILLLINFRIAADVERLRRDLGEIEKIRTELASKLGEVRQILDSADRDMKAMRSEFKERLEERNKSGAASR